jgi:RNA-binding protein
MPRDVPHQMIEPSVAVGKNGVTDSVIAEIKNQLKRKRIIKIRLHGESKLGRLEIAKELAQRCDAKLIDLRGFTVVLTRKKRKL